jgi:phenylacetate-CoA ligase
LEKNKGEQMSAVEEKSGQFYRPEAQTLSREQIRELQGKKLRHEIDRIWNQPIPFFKRKMESVGLRPEHIRTVDDLKNFPPTVKDELRQNEDENPPFGDYRGAPATQAIRLGRTTGTTGKPSTLLWTKKDYEIDAEISARSMWRAGMRPGMKLTHTHPGGLYAGADRLASVVETFGIMNVPMGPPLSDDVVRDHINLWKKIHPEVYVLFGPVMLRYHEAVLKAGLDPHKDIGMDILLIGEAACAFEATRKKYEKFFDSEIHNLNGSLEIGVIMATDCKVHAGMHAPEDYVVLEVINPDTKEPTPPGERGYLTLTTFDRDNIVIRYNLEDLVQVNPDPCPCGETHTRFYWLGRRQEVVNVSGREVLPVDVMVALNEIEELGDRPVEFQMERWGKTQDRLKVNMEYDPARVSDTEAFKEKITKHFRSRLQIEVEPALVDSAVYRTTFKPMRVIDVAKE